MTTRIFQYDIFDDSMEEFLKSVNSFEKVHIVSGNPQVLFNGLQNNVLLDNLLILFEILLRIVDKKELGCL